MQTDWKTVPIKDVYVGLYDGPHATPKPSDNGPIFLGIKNVGEDGRLDLSEIRHISEEEYPRWIKRIEPRAGDIVFSYEATLNRYAIIPNGFRGCLGRRMALIRPNDSKVNGKFLFYYFFSREWRDVISQNTLIGSTVDRIPIGKLPDFPIKIPPIPTQRKIAAILSGYDGLIENNLRRIKILREVAHNLYREWFVHFRFPGHEHTAFVNSPLGQIPKKWTVVPLGDLCLQMQSGGTPNRRKVEYWRKGTIDWYKTKELQDGFLFGSEEKISEEGLKSSSARLYERGTILMAIYGSPTVGRLGILSQPAACNQAALGMIADSSTISQEYLYYALYALRDHFNSLAQGAAQQNISKDKVANTLCLVPELSFVEGFTNLISYIWELQKNLEAKNRALRSTRDLLLPKLISGELDVSELDISVPVEAA